MGTWGKSMHVGSSLPARKKLREMDRDKQSSKHAFGAWSDDPTNKFVGGSLAVHRSVILVQLPDDSSLAGNGNSNCPSRFSSSSSLLVLALRLTAVSSASHPVSTKIRKKIVGPDFFYAESHPLMSSHPDYLILVVIINPYTQTFKNSQTTFKNV